MTAEGSNSSSIWRGHLSGTNSGELIVALSKKADKLAAKAVFFDRQYGPTIFTLNGVQSNESAEFRLSRFRGYAPIIPLDGSLTLQFLENMMSAEGKWQTDIGTTGICKLQKTTEHLLFFSAYSVLIEILSRARWLIPALYSTLLFSVTIAALSKQVEISASILCLLLLPIPFLFEQPVSKFIKLLRTSGVTKFGPLEIEQEITPAENMAAPASQNILNSPEQLLAQFKVLNTFFVFKTKLILVVITQRKTMPYAEFFALADALGVQPAHIELTKTALAQSGCVLFAHDGNIIITDLGMRYVLQGIHFP